MVVPVTSFCPGKSGFGWYHGLERSGTVVPAMERSDAEGGGACGTSLVSTPTRPRATRPPSLFSSAVLGYAVHLLGATSAVSDDVSKSGI